MIFAPKRFNNGIIYTMEPLNQRHPNESCLFFSEIVNNEILGQPLKIKLKPSSPFKKGVGSFDYCPATGEVFFSALNNEVETEEDALNLAIYSGTMDGLTIQDIKMLPFCDPTHNIGHSTISSDGKTLIFYYKIKKENINLYQSTRSSMSDNWSAPKPILELKSDGVDMFPKLINDSLLIFTSNRPKGKGSLDLYYSQKKNGHWSSPINWQAINTDNDEANVELIDNNSGYISANWEEAFNIADQLYYFKTDKLPWDK